jgi:hypothetical protein
MFGAKLSSGNQIIRARRVPPWGWVRPSLLPHFPRRLAWALPQDLPQAEAQGLPGMALQQIKHRSTPLGQHWAAQGIGHMLPRLRMFRPVSAHWCFCTGEGWSSQGQGSPTPILWTFHTVKRLCQREPTMPQHLKNIPAQSTPYQKVAFNPYSSVDITPVQGLPCSHWLAT